MPDEAARAAEYRRMIRARGRNKKAAEKALKGDSEARKALAEKTEPLLELDSDGVRRVYLP